MSLRKIPTRLLAPCLLTLLAFAGCRDDREPPLPGSGDSGIGDLASDSTPVASGGRSGSGGRTGAGGSGGQPGPGGRGGSGGGQAGAPGQGGVISVDAGAGGAGGMRIDAAPADRPADIARDTSSPDLPGRDTLTCGPVCAIFCPYGNVLDDRGCPTCVCNTRECKPSECSAAGAPVPTKPLPMVCPDGTTPAQTCERDSKGQCHLVTGTCSATACSTATTRVACQARTTCRWLTPGCSQPKLAAAGCYERAAIGCIAGGCPTGKTCTTQVIDPCGDRLSPAAPAEPALIPPPTCDACGQQITICL
jgi:hypothetical protein